MVTTDHTPIAIEQKKVEFENAAYGTIGLESAFGALNTVFSVEKTIELLTSGRKRFGIEEPKLKEGEKAEFTLFNPDENFIFQKENIFSTSKNSLFLGEKMKGKVYGIFANNKLTLA